MGAPGRGSCCLRGVTANSVADDSRSQNDAETATGETGGLAHARQNAPNTKKQNNYHDRNHKSYRKKPSETYKHSWAFV